MAPVGVPALDNTMGTLFIGVVLAMSLWGAGTVQVYYYFNRYRTDNWQIKLLVFTVWALDSAHQALITHTAYTYLVSEYGNAPFLGRLVPTLLVEVAVSALICFLVQSFLVMRVWRLSQKNPWLVGALMSLVVSELALSFVYTAQSLPLDTFTNLAKIVNLSRAINALAAAGDVAIAAALIVLLHRARTGYARSETIINRLILFSLNTGLLTSLCAIMSLITITVFPTTFIYIMFYVTVSRLYTNSLLATLNARKGIRGGHPDSSANAYAHGGDGAGGSVSLSMGRFRTARGGESTKGVPHALSIKVDTETTRDFYPESSKGAASAKPLAYGAGDGASESE